MADQKQGSNLDFQTTLKIKNLAAPTAASNDAARIVDVETAATSSKARANHTGTQVAATISDFDTQVRLSRLDQMAAPTGAVSFNSQKITNLGAPTAASNDAARIVDVENALAAVASGQTLKGSVRVVATTNITIATPGATIDGVAMSSGDVILLAGQTTGSQNGPYVWTASGSALTRATNWDSAPEAVVGSYWIVREGTNADKIALMTNDTFTFNTTTAAFAYIGAAGGGGGTGFQTTSPVVSAGGTWAVTHSLASKFIVWAVYRTGSPFDDLDVYGERLDANTLNIKPDIAMASGEYTVVVWKAA